MGSGRCSGARKCAKPSAPRKNSGRATGCRDRPFFEFAAPQLIDRASSVEVVLLGDGELASVSEAALLAGANLAVIGQELVQFAVAEMLAPGKYRLSQFLRGKQGTEWATGTHAAGERFVLLDARVLSLRVPSAAVGQSWTLRAVTAGMTLGSGMETGGTIVGNSLKPLAPVRLTGTRDGSGQVTFRWVRRARLEGGLRDRVEIPLMEESERYEVRLMHGTIVKRTWQASQPQQLYSAAEQLADFGSLQASYRLEVAQYSAQVGPGRSASEIIVLG